MKENEQNLIRMPGLLIIALVIAFLAAIGCDEGMNMTNGVITPPVEEPGEPTTNGEVKQPEPSEPTEPEPEPTPQPTVTIVTAAASG